MQTSLEVYFKIQYFKHHIFADILQNIFQAALQKCTIYFSFIIASATSFKISFEHHRVDKCSTALLAVNQNMIM